MDINTVHAELVQAKVFCYKNVTHCHLRNVSKVLFFVQNFPDTYCISFYFFNVIIVRVQISYLVIYVCSFLF